MLKSVRPAVQFGFIVLTLVGVFLLGANAERWCPFGGIEALYTYLDEGNMTCSLAVSNFYIMGAVLFSTILLRRVFCGYACPIGALSEWLQAGAAKLRIKPAQVPRPLDKALSLLKYPILAVVLYFTWKTGELVLRGYDPCYVLISRHGEDITFWAYIITGAVVIGSLFIRVPFCRWLCPMAAVLNPFSRFGITRLERNPDTCTSCRKCAKVCPMAIPVDEVEVVTHARCTSCLDCIRSCPEEEKGVLVWKVPSLGVFPARLSRWGAQSAVIALFLFIVTASVFASYLFPLPSFNWSRGEAPDRTASISMKIEGLNCRGSANLLVYYLDRDDELELDGYVKLEAWPEPGPADARIIYDPSRCNEAMIKMAVTEAYFDSIAQVWRLSPFEIQGYDPLGF